MSLGSLSGARIPHGAFSCLDGPLWTERVAPSSKRWAVAVFGAPGSKLAIIGGVDTGITRACAAYSLDFGVTWNTSPTTFPDTSGYGFKQYGVAYGNGVFAAALSATQGFISADGINWVLRTFPDITHLEFGEGIFLASRANSAFCYTSTDGVTWTSHAMPSNTAWGGVGIGDNGTCLIFYNSGCARSTDGGVTWGAAGTFSGSANVNSAAYGNGVWVATLGALAQQVRVSLDDGLTWGLSNNLQGSSDQWGRVRFVGGIFYVTDVGGLNCYKSTDGMNWTLANPLINMAPSFSVDWDFDVYTSYHYVAAGNGGSNTSVVNSGVCG